MATAVRKFYVARESFSGSIKGVPFVVNPSEAPVPEDDERVKAYPNLFAEWRPVEQATAAPGEKRER
jgi:hypothetical protein